MYDFYSKQWQGDGAKMLPPDLALLLQQATLLMQKHNIPTLVLYPDGLVSGADPGEALDRINSCTHYTAQSPAPCRDCLAQALKELTRP
jgi:hypothetical protein